MNKIKKISLIWVFLTIILSNCGLYKKNAVDYRKEPTQATDRAKKNVEEGRGISLGGIINRKTTYEFSSSNPMWSRRIGNTASLLTEIVLLVSEPF